jgi:hypothetical protein
MGKPARSRRPLPDRKVRQQFETPSPAVRGFFVLAVSNMAALPSTEGFPGILHFSFCILYFAKGLRRPGSCSPGPASPPGLPQSPFFSCNASADPYYGPPVGAKAERTVIKHMNPGSIVTCRNRDWVLLPNEDPNLLLLRPSAPSLPPTKSRPSPSLSASSSPNTSSNAPAKTSRKTGKLSTASPGVSPRTSITVSRTNTAPSSSARTNSALTWSAPVNPWTNANNASATGLR